MPATAISVLLISLCVFQQTLTSPETRQTKNSNGQYETLQVEDPALYTLSADNLTEDSIYLKNGVPHRGKKKIPPKDMVLNSTDMDFDVLPREDTSVSSKATRGKRFARPEPNMYWMKGIVPYTFHPNITNSNRRDALTTVARYNRNLCVTFVPWNTTVRDQYGLDHDGRIRFETGSGCGSYVGNLKSSSGQYVSCCEKGNCVHELGHTLGLYHEHQRFNREGWVRVNWDDITYLKEAYAKIQTNDGSTIKDYDLSSPMHYWLQIEPGVPPVMTVLFQELTVTHEIFYQFKELASMYQCKEQHCRDFNIECHNEGYVTKIDGKCSCRCVEGMDPATGCLTPLARSSTDPSQFPGGNYALLSPIDGCPINANMTTGSVTHFFISSSSQAPFMLQGAVSSGRARHYFCINSSPENGVQWPNGEYCIMRDGGSCPSGFEESSVQFDNTAQTGTRINGQRGNIPDGDYGNNTRFIFCCRDDGFSEDLMPLPSSYPFVLISTSSSGCQGVQGMTWTHLKFSVQNSLEEGIHGVTGSGARPFIGQNNNGNFEFHYCYYHPSILNCGGTIQLSESTRTATFTSPGYPGNYSNNLQCSWVIQSPENSTIILNFSDFDIDGNINSCDDKLVIQHSRIGQRGLSYCGRGMKASIRSHFNYMHVRLLTSLFDGSRGFNATVTVALAQDLCYDLSDRGATYRGKVNFTRTFQSCLPWTSVTNCPHNGFTSEDFSDGLDENYCRNPDKSFSPWCYTEAKLCKRDYCDVCMLEKPYDTADNCEEFKAAGSCSNQALARKSCSLTCADQLVPIEAPRRYTEIHCPTPSVPLDSLPTTQLAASYTLGQKVRFTCTTGNETRVTTCLSDGSWTPVQYVCGGCPDGWYPYRQTCYQSFAPSMNFLDASYFCGVYGGVIAEARDVNISDFLFKLRDDGSAFWLGLRETSEGHWVWQDGTEVRQTNWNTPPANPNSLTCGVLQSTYRWGDDGCGGQYYFNCQLQPHARKLCVDRKPDCAAMVRAIPNVCQQQPDYAWEVCPFTCKVCQACPSGWTEFQGACYKLHTDRIPFAEAEMTCADEGAILATAENEEEMNFVYLLTEDVFWLGGDDRETEGVWKWSDGTPFVYQHWKEGEPDNLQANINDCDCLLASRSGGWQDYPCERPRSFICKMHL